MNSPKSFPSPSDPQLIALGERHSWLALESLHEVDAWIQLQQDEMQALLSGKEIQPGLVFTIQPEGEVYLYTNQAGEITLELSEAALWLEALLTVIDNTAIHQGRIWYFPAERLVNLIWGMNALVLSSQFVCRRSKRVAGLD